MNEKFLCKIKKVDDYGIFKIDQQLYICFEDTNVKIKLKEINIIDSIKKMYNIGKIIYKKLIEIASLRDNINAIEQNYLENKKNFVLEYCGNLSTLNFEKETIYTYIYYCLKDAEIKLDSLLNPLDYSNWYREILMVKMCGFISDNSDFIKNDKTTHSFNDILSLLKENIDNVNIDRLYNYIQNIKQVPAMELIDNNFLKRIINPFIEYCGLPYYYLNKMHDISYNMQNILDTTNTTISFKKHPIGRNMLPLNNFINICVFIFIIEESNNGTFQNLYFDLEKPLKEPFKEFNIENLIESYNSTNTFSFEYNDFINYINKINEIIIKQYNCFYNVKFQNMVCKKLKGGKLLNILDLENLASFGWKYYFNHIQPNKSIFDDKRFCDGCGKVYDGTKFHALRGKNKDKELCDDCYSKHKNELNCNRVHKHRKNGRT